MSERYLCGHKPKPIIMDSNPMSFSIYLDWANKKYPKKCFNCFIKELKK